MEVYTAYFPSGTKPFRYKVDGWIAVANDVWAQAPQAVAGAQNHYIPKPYTIEKITRHTAMAWAFRVPVDFEGGFYKFVEVSLPLVGECPISISDFGEGWVELVIRNVGKVTSKLFELCEGDTI